MNHCFLEVKVKQTPTIRYTQDNKIPIAEMDVLFEGLRQDDPPATIKVVGWGALAQELQAKVRPSQRLIIEGRLRMNTVSRQDGTKEKKAEFTLSRMHQLSNNEMNESNNHLSSNHIQSNDQISSTPNQSDELKNISWDASPLVPDSDEIPF